MSVEAIGIVELGEICAAMEARSLDLFQLTGAWVFQTDEAAAQRRFAEASRRHAWHAELWAQRCPAIPPVERERLVASSRRPIGETHPGGPDASGVAHYSECVDELVAELDDIERRVDPELDPSTARVITLVRRDLVDVRDR